jgi:8-oxo-dGTP pyrophosphatase MutT (NUDIX family)
LGAPIEKESPLSALRRRFEPLLRRVFHFYWRFARGATLGAFALVIDGQRRVFLIQHSYISGWHLPGGGVESGETIKTALARELMEEGNIKLTGEPVLHGVFHNRRVSRRDHVAFFVVRDFVQDSPPVPDHEIVAHGFFAIDELPADTGRAARARIAEVFEGRAVSELW